MSYDLDLYIGKDTVLTPPDAGPGGQFAVDPPARVDDEDIPEPYMPLVGKRRRWLVRIYIEGKPGPSALGAFDDWLTGVLGTTNGVLIDEQTERFQTAKTTGALPSASESPAKDEAELGEMSFFFEDVESFVPIMLPAILKIIRDVLPEAMPVRFGQYEPLRGTVENGNTKPLLKEFQDDPDQFMKAKTPFAHIYTHVASTAELAKWHPDHSLRREFLAGNICFELRPKALDDPRLQTLMWEIAKALNVFYAEIRATSCPVRAWFWTGIPAGPVRAFALGPPYAGLWPEAEDRAVARAGDLVLVAPTRLEPTLPDPPSELRDPNANFQPGAPHPEKYASLFPFDPPAGSG